MFSGSLGLSSSGLHPEIWGYSYPVVFRIPNDCSYFYDQMVGSQREEKKKNSGWNHCWSQNLLEHRLSYCLGSFPLFQNFRCLQSPIAATVTITTAAIAGLSLGHERMEKIHIYFLKRNNAFSSTQSIRIPLPDPLARTRGLLLELFLFMLKTSSAFGATLNPSQGIPEWGRDGKLTAGSVVFWDNGLLLQFGSYCLPFRTISCPMPSIQVECHCSVFPGIETDQTHLIRL